MSCLLLPPSLLFSFFPLLFTKSLSLFLPAHSNSFEHILFEWSRHTRFDISTLTHTHTKGWARGIALHCVRMPRHWIYPLPVKVHFFPFPILPPLVSPPHLSASVHIDVLLICQYAMSTLGLCYITLSIEMDSHSFESFTKSLSRKLKHKQSQAWCLIKTYMSKVQFGFVLTSFIKLNELVH